MTDLYPLMFEPVLKHYLWGGRNLSRLGRALPPGQVVAESWEIAGHEDGTTRVANGPFRGRLLTAVQAELGLALVGSRSAWAHQRGKFPLLVKLIDAEQPLSVQVHPNDEYALANEGDELGKTEMWVVLDARPDAELILGLAQGTTREAFCDALLAGRAEKHLHRVPVRAGDHVCVPAGTVHAIMDGILIAEIQQNSNTTYRVFDWNRLGPDGKPRPLHIDKALDATDFSIVEPGLCPPEPLSEEGGCRRHLLCRNRYFVTERVELRQGAAYCGHCDGSTLEIWGVISGSASVNGLALDAVRFALLPAELGEFAVEARDDAVLLRTYVE